MSLPLVLPPSLEYQLRSEAEREGLSLQDHVSLVLNLSTALLKDEGETPLRQAVNDFFAKRSLDSYRVSQALRDLLQLAASSHDPGEQSELFQSGIAADDPTTILERVLGTSMKVQRNPQLSGFGKYADLLPSSDDFAREKQEDLAREEANREEYRARRLRDPGVPSQ